MQIEYIESYTDHGCNLTNQCGKMGMIRYWDEASHGFNSAYRSNGIFDKLEEAKAMAKAAHPHMEIRLAIPDLVFFLNDQLN